MPDSASTVWWASAAIDDAGSPWEKFRAIVHRTGFLDRMDDGDNVAIKVHMSELGNIRGIRPMWVRYVADMIREAGGQPFVTDTTTLYRRGRVTLQKYLDTAARHGFSPQTMGCPVIIADGFGNAGTYVTQDAKRYKRVPVAQAIYEADALVNLAHPTLHPSFPIAAAIKNIGMGCTTKEAKIRMHAQMAAPKYNADRCIGCWVCVNLCPGGAFEPAGKVVRFNEDDCIGCGECIAVCRGGALNPRWDADSGETQLWTIEATRATLSTFADGKVVHLAIGTDFTAGCDCGENSLPIVTDLGLFGSNDPAALDRACWDRLHEVDLYPGGLLDQIAKDPEKSAGLDLSSDRASAIYEAVEPERFWTELLPESGLGTGEYRLEPVGK